MSDLAVTLRTLAALGLSNVARVASYRLGLRTGLGAATRLRATLPDGPYFREVPANDAPREKTRPGGWPTAPKYFGAIEVAVAQPPDWHANPFTGARVPGSDRPWWKIPDFDPAVGDIKAVWEASRFDWVIAFVRDSAAGDGAAIPRLNCWLADWSRHNPAFFGPNWKCGQEASIRVMHLAMAALLGGQADDAEPALAGLIDAHLRRIAPTVGYAIAQDNNHGTSEAAALFIGGEWLASRGSREGRAWHARGRRLLEDRMSRLVAADGSFSQYSVNYHRMMLDTICMAEIWRRRRGLPAFSANFVERAAAATEWLRTMTDPVTGDAPNLGANDGARLLPLTDTRYRDFRPSTQLASALFRSRLAWPEDGESKDLFHRLGLQEPELATAPPASRVFDDGGYAVLRRGRAFVAMRYPRFRFRPGQADVMHVDLWLAGENLLRDAGSYSYNSDARWQEYFPGTESHNTVQFDDRDQMPRLGRFLFGDWLKTSSLEPLEDNGQVLSFGTGYADRFGASHFRRLFLSESGLRVKDRVDGFAHHAVLRWRLAPGDWRLQDNVVTNGAHVLEIGADVPLADIRLTEGWESRHYLQKTALPVLEVRVARPGTLATDYRWAP